MNQFIKIHGRHIHYRWINHHSFFGNKPLLLFLHEGLGSVAQWKDFPELLSNQINFPALIFDRIGYGLSEKEGKKREENYMHVEAFEVLPELLEQLGIKQPLILIGHSDGATIALLFAARYPRKVKAVVSIAAHVFVEECTVEGIKKVAAHYKSRLREKLVKYHADKTDKVFYDWADIWTSPSFRNWNIEQEIKNNTAPLLIIQGKNDEYATIAQVEAIEKAVKGITERFIVADCGHSPHLEEKERIVQRIIEFLNL